MDAIIRFAIFEGNIQNFSSVVKDTFVHDGSTTTFTLTQTHLHKNLMNGLLLLN